MSAKQPGSAAPALPTLPVAGGALQGPGINWGQAAMTGETTLEMALPLSPGRGFDPMLSLGYRSRRGNSPFGRGWDVPCAVIGRDVRKGVPAYREADVFVSPTGVELAPERDAQGRLHSIPQDHYNGLKLRDMHQVVRYFPVIESDHTRIEHWSSTTDTAGFWLVQGSDGCVHLYGKTAIARLSDPKQPAQVAQWLLQESLNPQGEQIYYHYKEDDQVPLDQRDYRAQRYLARVCYANLTPRTHLALWDDTEPEGQQWHFQLLFDYGERSADLSLAPTYSDLQAWTVRTDPFSSYAFGFELGTRRLCRQILMFHYFAAEASLGPAPVLTRRLLLEYSTNKFAGSQLRAIHQQAYDADGKTAAWPPLEFSYRSFKLLADASRYQPFDAMAGLNDGQHYQLVDLYSDGLPGILLRDAKSWYYREPQRAASTADSNAVAYGPWEPLARIPASDHNARQALVDMDGDGQLDWLTAQPGLSGTFTLNDQRQWSSFTPFSALPQEFFHPQGQLADLMGAGLYDLVMIGSRSVRLYANRQAQGFGPGQDVPHTAEDDSLPLPGNGPSELVAFCDVLGSGQQHLVRIRHDELKCWPNLGRGRFGKGFVWATLPFAHDRFDAANIRLADLNASGAADLLYVETEHVLIFMNHQGQGLDSTPVKLPWPDGVRHDATCQVSTPDLQGLGCSSLVLTVPHKTPRHWRYDFTRQTPYLMIGMANNMGLLTKLDYRSSAQEWLDEKWQRQLSGQGVSSGLPFPVSVVTRHMQQDQVSSNQVSRHWQYREGFYNRVERRFAGFGLLLETDSPPRVESSPATDSGALLTKRWFYTARPGKQAAGHFAADSQAPALKPHVFTWWDDASQQDKPLDQPTAATRQAADLALSGALMREEIYAAEDPPIGAVPYSVRQQRYQVRLTRPLRQPDERAVVLATLLETLTCVYERQADDPVCHQAINLRYDKYGALIHSLTLHYPRRMTAIDTPPFNDPHEQQWWRDAHDPAQQACYLNESRAQFIHLEHPQRWRLHLPWRQRNNTLVLAKSALTGGYLSAEQFADNMPGNPLGANAKRQLSGLSEHYYCPAQGGSPLPSGSASFQALLSHQRVATLDEQALAAYENLPTGLVPDLSQWLQDQHLHPMALFLPATANDDPPIALWSVEQNITRYANAEVFYRPRDYQASHSHGATLLTYDAYSLQLSGLTTADGCSTEVRYDYRLGLPMSFIDAQRTRTYACYTAFGQLCATGLAGKEHGQAVGNDDVTVGARLRNVSPAQALADPRTVLSSVHSACFYQAFSWMGHIPRVDLDDEWVSQGYVLPSGHIRASALPRLKNKLSLKPHEQKLRALIDKASRAPVHVVVLQTDRLQGTIGETDNTLHMALVFSDGLGRIVQSLQKTQPGEAYEIDDQGMPTHAADQLPQLLHSPARWRMSAAVEYNNKGLVVRTWRPCFINRPGFVTDASIRSLQPFDQQFHDPLGRLTHTLSASTDTCRQTHWAWYTVNEDENDTHGL